VQLRGRSRSETAFVLVAVDDAARPRGAAPFVGRQRQRAALRLAFRDCVEDTAPVLATVLGEPGIGKSRLLEQVRAELGADALVLSGTTPAYGDAVAYAP